MRKKPTKTEKLFFGRNGASDPKNPFRLERDLISSERWPKLYDKMPPFVQNIVNELKVDPWSCGCSIGIGRNDAVGWFVLGCGQGPCVIWLECDADKYTLMTPRTEADFDEMDGYL